MRSITITTAAILMSQAALGQPCSDLQHVASPNAGSEANFLMGAAGLSADEAWAVGHYRVGLTEMPLSMRWNGVSWEIVPMPVPTSFGGVPHANIQSVRAFASDDVWAVGSYPGTESAAQETMAYHWDGLEWSIVPSPAGSAGSYGSAFYCVDGVSANDFWAVGHKVAPAQGTRPLAARWTGSGWEEHLLPNGSAGATEALADLHVRSPDDIWALEEVGVGAPVNPKRVFHWDGSSWSEGAGRLNPLRYAASGAIFASAPDDIWVSAVVQSSFQMVMVHWDGSTWVEHPTPRYAYEFFGDASGNVYGVGATGIVRWNGAQWILVASLSAFPNGNFFDADVAPDGALCCAGVTMSGSGARTLTARVQACTPTCFLGDVDCDGDVDLTDLAMLLSAFGSCTGDPAFNAGADFDNSGCVELGDLALLLANFGT